MKKLLFLALLLISASKAIATGYVAGPIYNGAYTSTQCYSTQAAACAAAVTNSANSQYHFDGYAGANQCWVSYNSTGAHAFGASLTGCDVTCPNGQGRVNGQCGTCPDGQSVQADGSCGCPAGTEYYGSQCVAPCNTAAGTLGFPVAAGATLSLGSPSQCVNKCGFTITDIVDISGNGGGQNCATFPAGDKKCFFKGNGTGSHCSGTTTGTAVAAATPVGTSTTTTTTSTGTTSTATTTSINPDGSTSTATTITTTPSGGTATTSTATTTTSSTGTKTGTGSGSGSGAGTGSGTTGTGTGGTTAAGQCDPTSTDYAQCIAGTQSAYHDFGESSNTRDSLSDDYYSKLSQTGIGQMADSISGGLPSGSCPVVHFDMFNRSFTMDFWCTIYSQNASTFSTIAHAGWVIMGITIILGA